MGKSVASQDRTTKACGDAYLVLANSTGHLNSRDQEYPFEAPQDFCGLSNSGSEDVACIHWKNILQQMAIVQHIESKLILW